MREASVLQLCSGSAMGSGIRQTVPNPAPSLAKHVALESYLMLPSINAVICKKYG